MEILIESRSAATITADLLLIGLFADSSSLTPGAAAVDSASGGAIQRVLSLGDFRGQANETAFVYPDRGSIARVGLVGLGPRAALTPAALQNALAAATRRAAAFGGRRVAAMVVESAALGDFGRALGYAAVVGPFDPGKSKAGEEPIQTIVVAGVAAGEAEALRAAVAEGVVIGRAVNDARHLVYLPPNVLTPTALAEAAQKLAAECGLSSDVWDGDRLQAEGMTAFLAVARGSSQPPRLVMLKYTAPGAKATLALVGKGVTFDAGGLGLKDTPEQRLMKNDMSGAAAVLGAMRIIAHRKPRLNVIALIPSAENMPDGNALRTGDVIPSKSGRRIEILDTDCEGRLLLCDTFTYAHSLGATHLIDIATLSGACARAFADVVTPVMGYDRPTVERLLAAGQATGELLWEMPLLPAYRAMLNTSLADLKNYGGSAAAAITAGSFLGEFAEGKPWAHLDIAATCWADKDAPWRASGPTGIGVRLLAEYAQALAHEVA
jgi:leucyl aminopeptidase